MTVVPVTVLTPVRPWRTRVAVATAVLALSVSATAWLLDEVRHGTGASLWDGPTLRWMVGHREPVASAVMTAVSAVGAGPIYWAIALVVAVVLLVRRRWVDALLLTFSVVSADTISRVMKLAVNRARPPADLVLGLVERSPAFPSGHTIGTAALALAVAYVWWRGRPGQTRAAIGLVIALAVTALMATSRLYLAVHWLTDVLASTFLSFGVLALASLIDTFIQQRFPARPAPAA